MTGTPHTLMHDLIHVYCSHGGSCCSCGGRLPLPHSHIAIQVLDQPEWRTGSTFGGNTCSWRCTLAFLQWATTARDENLCPGHGRPDR